MQNACEAWQTMMSQHSMTFGLACLPAVAVLSAPEGVCKLRDHQQRMWQCSHASSPLQEHPYDERKQALPDLELHFVCHGAGMLQ